MGNPYFRPSLRVPSVAGPVVTGAVLVAMPSAWLYARATVPAPEPVNLLCTVGLAAWLALLMHVTARLGKVRNPAWMAKAGAAVAALAWYVHWAAWMTMGDRAASPHSEVDGLSVACAALYLCLRPDLMIGIAAGILGEASSPLNGLARIVVWLIELASMVLPAMATGAAQARAPFCEQTGCWAREMHVPLQFAFLQNPDEAREKLEQDPGQLHRLLIPTSEDADCFADVTIHACRGGESFITVSNFAAMAPEEVPIREIGSLSKMMPERVSCFGQVDGPVVELLRFPVDDPEALIKHWEDEAARASAEQTAGE